MSHVTDCNDCVEFHGHTNAITRHVCDPAFGRQRCQAVGEPGAIALWACLAGLPGWLQFMTGGWSLRIDFALRLPANRSLQGGASRSACLRSTHDQAMKIERFSQMRGCYPAEKMIGFRPMKGNPEKRATGAAGQAGVVHL